MERDENLFLLLLCSIIYILFFFFNWKMLFCCLIVFTILNHWLPKLLGWFTSSCYSASFGLFNHIVWLLLASWRVINPINVLYMYIFLIYLYYGLLCCLFHNSSQISPYVNDMREEEWIRCNTQLRYKKEYIL